jgi:hypothetical protein
MAREGIDTSRPSPARVYCHLAGGKDTFAADRAMAETLTAAYPGLRGLVADNRRFTARAVTWLASGGITQYLDLGCGLPLEPMVHQTARATQPDARVVYADRDPVVMTHIRALAAGPGIASVEADIRDVDAVLGDPGLKAVLNLDQPCAVLLCAVLDGMTGAEAAAAAAGYARALAPGSAITISCAHYRDRELAARMAALYAPAGQWHDHGPAAVAGWFQGAGLADPDGGPVLVADTGRWQVPFQRWAVGQAAPARRPHVIGGVGLKD